MALERAVRRAEDARPARSRGSGSVPRSGKQTYKAANTFVDATAAITPGGPRHGRRRRIDAAQEGQARRAGFFTDSARFDAIGNRNGLFGYQRSTTRLHLTVRTDDGRGSGWVARSRRRRALRREARRPRATQKAKARRRATRARAGQVHRDPRARRGGGSRPGHACSARRALGRRGPQLLSKQGGGNKLGEKMFDEHVNIYADPVGPESAGRAVRRRRLRRAARPIIKKGVSKSSRIRASGRRNRARAHRAGRQHDDGRRRRATRS